MCSLITSIIIIFNILSDSCSKDSELGEDFSLTIGDFCLKFVIDSCEEGCNYNEADQVCKALGHLGEEKT